MFGPAPGPLTVGTALSYMNALSQMVAKPKDAGRFPTPPFTSTADPVRSLQIVTDYQGRILQKIADRLPGVLDITI